ncbi:MAG: DUF3078 domain-containing protein [Bacteroidota bacterium]|nr:DUF3078 domain-containing protein [Bacteroidota bacterium]
MMKRIVVFMLSNMLFFIVATAQDIPVRTLPNEIFRSVKKDDKDTTKWIWKRGGLVNLNLSQGSLSNWSAGGDNFSMSLNTHVNYSVFYRKGVHTWDNSFDFNFGYVQTSSLGSRKNDDRIDFFSKYGRQIDTLKKLYASTLFDFRSQLFDGRNYTSSTESNLTSTFLSPAYIILSVGFDYKPRPTFSLFFSPLTNRTTLVTSNTISAKGSYGVDTGSHVYNEVGAFASINYFMNIKKDIITYKGRLDLFSNYARNPQNIDIYMTNLFSFKINKFLAATYSLETIYDDNIRLFGPNHTSPGLQLKSLIGIGFTMPFAQEKR